MLKIVWDTRKNSKNKIIIPLGLFFYNPKLVNQLHLKLNRFFTALWQTEDRGKEKQISPLIELGRLGLLKNLVSKNIYLFKAQPCKLDLRGRSFIKHAVTSQMWNQYRIGLGKLCFDWSCKWISWSQKLYFNGQGFND